MVGQTPTSAIGVKTSAPPSGIANEGLRAILLRGGVLPSSFRLAREGRGTSQIATFVGPRYPKSELRFVRVA
jgi:hypothetical protein